MRVIVENYKIECFENEIDYKNWLSDHRKETHLMSSGVYGGKMYGIPQEVKDLFSENVLVSIKKQNYNDVQYVYIHS